MKKLKRRVSKAIETTAEVSKENKENKNDESKECNESGEDFEIDENEIEDIIFNETEGELADTAQEESSVLISLEKKINSIKKQQKEKLQHLLPEPNSLRRAHHHISCYLEGKVGIEMLKSGRNYLMPDGTSHQKLDRRLKTLLMN